MSSNPAAQLASLLNGYKITQALAVAAQLNIAEHLAGGPRSADDLAVLTGTHGPSLYRLLRALASLGVFAEQPDGRFTLTPMAELLRDDVPQSQRAAALMIADNHYRAYGELKYSIETGKPGFERTYGVPVFEYLTQNPEAGRIFDAAMTSIHGRETEAMLEAYDFSGIRRLIDVGGGNGSLLAAVLERTPSLRGILFDLPPVVERARRNIESAGLANRVEFAAGDFFEAVPVNGDACIMRHIIHDWDDDRARRILKHCHAAIEPGGRLLLGEYIIPAGNAPGFSKLLDLTMLVLPGGKERTESEYRELLKSGGFELRRVVTTPSEICILEADRL